MKTQSLFRTLILASLAILGASPGNAKEQPQPVSIAKGGQLSYLVDANKNRVPDFSSAGYGGGGVPIPEVAARVAVAPVEGDDGARIQAALDFVSSLPADSNGFRGAVLLQKGRYEIAGALRIATSGVILRGQGQGPDGTVLVAAGDDRRTLIQVGGTKERVLEVFRAVTDAYVPVGETTIHLNDCSSLKVGDTVIVQRPSAAAWIRLVGMDDAPSRPALVWKPDSLNVQWDRVITAISGDSVTLDAPLTTALDKNFGGGTLAVYSWPERIEKVGVENLRCESAFDSRYPQDEEHAWICVGLDAVQNAWVRSVSAIHFVSSAVDVGSGSKWVTVQDCSSLEPVSELVGYRRHSFHGEGQLTLFLRCQSEEGLHDFTVGYLTAGPNVFLECEARESHGFSGSIGSWSSGTLFDKVKVDGGTLSLDNLENWNQDVGWSAANSVFWQCTASEMICRQPPGAQNWAVGVWSKYRGDGYWSLLNNFVQPESLYQAQLALRKGQASLGCLAAGVWRTEDAGALALDKVVPDLPARLAPRPQVPGKPLVLKNGWLVAGEKLLIGTQFETPTWMMHPLPSRAPERGAALTRFMPGRVGPGLTDDLETLGRTMLESGEVAVRHHWGLWYDRRRDDHQMIRRLSGDVWAPFLEQAWARSGNGRTWNGLSKYDLTRYNPWYFRRLRDFAEVCREKGLVLINEMYFQHNIIEAGAHWADFPWRPANAVQNAGFQEPPPYEGGKRIFMAESFYDLSNPLRRELHRSFMRHCFENLAGHPNVIHMLSDEFTGPLPFTQFWLDVARDWEKETGQNPLIAISATKDVQDSILADPERGPLVSVIDFQYWWRTDGGLFAPVGGQSLSPRQHERLWKGGRPTADSIAGMVGEYRRRFPGKAVIARLRETGSWSFVAAGGSLPQLPKTTDEQLLKAIPCMQSVPSKEAECSGVWQLSELGKQRLVHIPRGVKVTLDLSDLPGKLKVSRVILTTGKLLPSEEIIGGTTASFTASSGEALVLWLCR